MLLFCRKNQMKRIIVFSLLFLHLSINSQTPQWLARQSLTVTAKRTLASSFAIADKIYVIGGMNSATCLNDVWQYDINSNIWIQKNDFPGAAKKGITAFSMNGKGYLVGGNDCNRSYLAEVWEYNPTSDTWTKKTDFAGGGREEAASFVIGNKAYVGTGYAETYGANNTYSYAYNDWWEYTPTTDTWIQKSNVPGQGRGWAISNSLNGKGYLGLGSSSTQTLSFNDFYEYDTASDVWTTKANYPLSLGDAMCFSYGSEIYVCGGINFSNFQPTSSVRKYNPTTNTWTNQTNMGGGITMGAVSVNANGRAFVGTGYTSSFIERGDWWELGAPNLTSLNNETSLSEIILYPNPSHGKVHLLFNSESPLKAETITLRSLLGSDVSYTVKHLSNTELLLEIETATKGIYFLTYCSNTITTTKKLIIE
jgi:N-acetylneuraminic acid mutarotase